VMRHGRVSRLNKIVGPVVGLTVLAAVLGACLNAPTGSTADLGTKASTGGKLTVLCGAQETWCQAMTRAFQAASGIPTTYQRLSGGEALAALRATQGNPEFDVWHGSIADGYAAAKDEGLLEPYSPPIAAQIPDRVKDKDGAWTGVYVSALSFCSNRRVLDELGVPLPESWQDLLNPKLKGQIALAHPATSGTAFMALWTVVSLYHSDVDKAFDYFKKLHNNILQYPKTGSAPGMMAGRGEVATAIISSYDCILFNEQGMQDLVLSFPSEGTGYEIGGVAIVKGATHLEAAKKYLAWALSAEAQEIPPTVQLYQMPTNPTASVSPKSPKLSEIKLLDYDFVQSGALKKALTERFDAEVASEPRH
jgi:iron(III) transport system substrate-binding protein